MSPLSAPEPRLCIIRGDAGPKTESLTKGTDFNRAWRSSNLRALSKTVEVVVKGYWEEIDRVIGDKCQAAGCLIYKRELGKTVRVRTDLKY